LPAPNAASSLATVLPVVESLSETIRAENDDLFARRRIDYRTHSARKSQGLIALVRLQPALANLQCDARAREALGELTARLETNKRLLEAELCAARTVAEIVARAIREGQSDGTYSANVWRENRR
jgi:hypothetical protein